MFERPDIMRMAQELASHSSARQAEIARNVANADTPGYRARDVMDFAKVWSEDRGMGARTSRPGHVADAASPNAAQLVVDTRSEASPNGNTVSLEQEMVKSSEVRHTHEIALSVYKSSLDMMRTVVGRR